MGFAQFVQQVEREASPTESTEIAAMKRLSLTVVCLALALGLLRAEPDLSLEKKLKSTNMSERIRALDMIANSGDKSYSRAVCELLTDRVSRVADAARTCLEKINPDLCQSLMALKESDDRKHLGALEKLLTLEDINAAESIMWAHFKSLRAATAPSRCDLIDATASILTKIGATRPETLKQLLATAENRSQPFEVRGAVLLALVNNPDTRRVAKPAVVEALREPSMRLLAVEAAVRSEDKDLVSDLKKLTTDKEAAAEAIRAMEGDPPMGAILAQRQRCLKAAHQYLANTQKADGSWATGMGMNDPAIVVTTSLAGLSLMDAGKGYQTSVDKAARYVSDHLLTNTLPVKVEPSMDQAHWKLGLGGFFLCEYASKRKEFRFALDKLAERLVADIVKRQEQSGGWGHTPRIKNPLDYVELEVMSNWMLATLGCLRRLGHKIPSEPIDKALKFIEDCCEEGKGGVGYSPNAGQKGFGDPCRTGGAIAAFALLDRTDSPLYRRMVDFWKRSFAASNEGHGSLALGFLGSALGARQADQWAAFDDRFSRQILAHARLDGSFRVIKGQSPQAQANADGMVGPAYTTATYSLILCLGKAEFSLFGHRFAEK
jgi:hypothetical protein